jgi:hypothetical protein
MEKIDARDLYESLLQLIMHAEKTASDRLNMYLLANSFLVVAWATIFHESTSGGGAVVEITITVLGLVGGIVWSDVGRRTRIYMEHHFAQALEIEKTEKLWEQELLALKPKITWSGEAIPALPLTSAEAIRVGANKLTRMSSLVITTPLAFSVLYLVLASVSVAGFFGCAL